MASIIRLDANEHPIKSVTVFKSNKAEVVRIFKVSLEEGQSKIQIRRLPGSIDTESARVTGLGGDAQLFDVVCSIGHSVEDIDTTSTAEVVRKLNARSDALEGDVDSTYDIYSKMLKYADSLANNSVPPQEAERFFESLMSRSRAMSSARAEMYEEMDQIERQVKALSSSEKKKKGKVDGEVSVIITAKQATDIELRLTYLVRNATWSAAYELHASTEAGIPTPSVFIHYRARITQSTGEDWTDVKLTLSTADMDVSNETIPVLSPTKIQPYLSHLDYKAGVPYPPGALGQTSVSPAPAFGQGSTAPRAQPTQLLQPPKTGVGAPATPASSLGTSAIKAQPTSIITHSIAAPADEWQDIGADPVFSAKKLTTAIGEPKSIVHESPLALTYHVEGASSVPSDDVPHQVPIAVLPFEAKILHVTVPKVRPVAYLQATVKNTSDHRLLPGTVHAFIDDSFVSKTSIVGDVAPGDVFSCTLGADSATIIRYARTAKRADDAGDARERSTFSEQSNTTTYRSRTTVTNRHPFALRELVVRDGVPVSSDEKRVNVVLRHPACLAELEQGDELPVGAKDGGVEGKGKQTVRWGKQVDGKGGKKEGLFEWVVEVGAGEELTIETEWDVKAHVFHRWIEST